ncbi:MAG: tetratricopeptide repeat protein [Planctomycetaceae bacterium]
MAKSSRGPRSGSKSRDKSAGGPSQPAKRGGRARAERRPKPARSALEQAHAILERGFKSADYDKLYRAAQKALEVSVDCSEAWLVLAEQADDRREGLALCRQAVAAAERGLGADALETAGGAFWELPETRSYLRARAALADRYWSLGERNTAIEHMQELLRLDVQDHQGLRYLLATRLTEAGRDDELAEVLSQYDEESTFWDFSNALAAFRREGDTAASRQLLNRACRSNRHVAELLLSHDKDLPELPIAFAPGSRPEAAAYVREFAGGWVQSPGAITWFRETLVADRLAGAAALPVGPTAEIKGQLRELPQAYGLIWQAAVHRVAAFLEEAGQPIRPWSVLVVSETERLIRAQQLAMAAPTAAAVFDEVARAMLDPLAGGQKRPSEIQVREAPLWEELRPHLEEIGVDVIYRTELEEADFAVRDLTGVFAKDHSQGSLVTLPGATDSAVGELYSAAAEFYRRAPWQRLPVDALIGIESRAFSPRRPTSWHAVVMGQSNVTLGLAIYDSGAPIAAVCVKPGAASESARCVSLMFSEGFEIGSLDLAACVRNAWELGGPEAYPLVIEVADDRQAGPPALWRLELLTACLRAIPPFVERCASFDERVSKELVVSVAGREVELTLSVDPDLHVGCGDACDCS